MRNHAVKYGIYYGGISVAISLLLWLLSPETLFNMGIGLAIGFGVPIIFMYLSIHATKAEQEGFISFGESLKASFLTYMIGSLMGVLFTFVLMNYLDPSLLEMQKEVAIKVAEDMSSMFGAPEEAMEEMREQMESQNLDTMTFGQSMLGWLGGLIFPGLILALIMSGILKKNN